jgi:hypothetical protein
MHAVSMANAGARLKKGKKSNPASRMFGCRSLLNYFLAKYMIS